VIISADGIQNEELQSMCAFFSEKLGMVRTAILTQKDGPVTSQQSIDLNTGFHPFKKSLPSLEI
jgi:hypothetical protein